jgi:hypothetical protein
VPTIILSYRREDTAWIAGRVHDRLKGHFGEDNVFMDIDSIPFGLDFREHIQDSLDRCDILVAIVGPRWPTPDESGRLRLTDKTDWVRIEIEAALAKKISVIPVLIDGAALPAPADLPEGLRNLAFRQAAPVDCARDFHPHMDRLIKAMDKLLERAPRQLNREQDPAARPRRDEGIGAGSARRERRQEKGPEDNKHRDHARPGCGSQGEIIQSQPLPSRPSAVLDAGPDVPRAVLGRRCCDLPADVGCGARARFPLRGVLDHAGPRHADHLPSRGVSVAVGHCGGRRQTPA